MDPFLTPEQEIVLDVIFALQGEARINRTREEYLAIAARAPKLFALHSDVNKALKRVARYGVAPYEICTFKGSKDGRPADRYYRYKKFPTSLSRETVRLAWMKSGMRALQLEAQAAQRTLCSTC